MYSIYYPQVLSEESSTYDSDTSWSRPSESQIHHYKFYYYLLPHTSSQKYIIEFHLHFSYSYIYLSTTKRYQSDSSYSQPARLSNYTRSRSKNTNISLLQSTLLKSTDHRIPNTNSNNINTKSVIDKKKPKKKNRTFSRQSISPLHIKNTPNPIHTTHDLHNPITTYFPSTKKYYPYQLSHLHHYHKIQHNTKLI